MYAVGIAYIRAYIHVNVYGLDIYLLRTTYTHTGLPQSMSSYIPHYSRFVLFTSFRTQIASLILST